MASVAWRALGWCSPHLTMLPGKRSRGRESRCAGDTKFSDSRNPVVRCEISEGEVRFFSSPFFFFFEFSRDLNRQWKSRKTLVVGFLGFVFSMRNVTFTSASAGFTTIHLIDEKRKAQPFQMETFVTGVRGGGDAGARRRRSRQEPTKGRAAGGASDRSQDERSPCRETQSAGQAGRPRRRRGSMATSTTLEVPAKAEEGE